MFPANDPTQSIYWNKLQNHHAQLSQLDLRTLFQKDEHRFKDLHLEDGELLLDYSKNLIQKETLDLLTHLAEDLEVPAALEAWSQGQAINRSEERAVLHQRLRAPTSVPFYVDGVNISRSIEAEKQKMKAFCNLLHQGKLLGFSHKPINTIVNIGIGGSHLGGQMVCEALRPFHKPDIRTHFVSNLDPNDLLDTLSNCDPERTLFLIASKTFTTAETLSNAQLARNWFLQAAQDTSHISLHFAALSTAEEKVLAFGISKERIFRFWDWVGGRFSLWSSIGLSIACTVGWAHFESLLSGAHRMDQHFLKQPPRQNMPLILALLSLWYRNFFHTHSHAVLCYTHHLRYFVPFLQQLIMESNGKSIDRSGSPTHYPTSAVIWGGTGTNAQHSFHQLLHQGTDLISCDFIGVLRPEHSHLKEHQALLSHCIAQSRALMWGRSQAETLQEQTPAKSLKDSLVYRSFKGNRPSNTILIQSLRPEALGALIALYEHKVLAEGVLWNIYSFDQWGVELGKEIAGSINETLHSPQPKAWDSSTTSLIQHTQGRRTR